MNSILAATSYRDALADEKLSRDKLLKLPRRTIDERQSWAERTGAFNSSPFSTSRVYLPAPYRIGASDPTRLSSTNIQAWNSSAEFHVAYDDEIDAPSNYALDSLNFFFSWTNNTGQDTSVTAATLLLVKGHARAIAVPGYIPGTYAYASIGWSGRFSIHEYIGNVIAEPTYEQNQAADFGFWAATAWSTFPLYQNVHQDRGYVFRTHRLDHNSFFFVPRGAIVLFQVSLEVNSHLEGGGGVYSRLSDDGFVSCPFVELHVASSGTTTTVAE
jgi:hypothetical protein